MDTRTIIRFVIVTLLLALGGLAGWQLYNYARLARKPKFPTGIVIHHTATPPVVRGKRIDVAAIDAMHARRGFAVTDNDGVTYHIGYHFLVLQDGTILRGRPEHLRGAHAKGYPQMLGIALVGNFQRSSNRGRCGPLNPPQAQLTAAVRLTQALMAKYDLSSAHVHLHRDLCPTACPGDGFPRVAFFSVLDTPQPPLALSRIPQPAIPQ